MVDRSSSVVTVRDCALPVQRELAVEPAEILRDARLRFAVEHQRRVQRVDRQIGDCRDRLARASLRWSSRARSIGLSFGNYVLSRHGRRRSRACPVPSTITSAPEPKLVWLLSPPSVSDTSGVRERPGLPPVSAVGGVAAAQPNAPVDAVVQLDLRCRAVRIIARILLGERRRGAQQRGNGQNSEADEPARRVSRRRRGA